MLYNCKAGPDMCGQRGDQMTRLRASKTIQRKKTVAAGRKAPELYRTSVTGEKESALLAWKATAFGRVWWCLQTAVLLFSARLHDGVLIRYIQTHVSLGRRQR